VLDTLSGFRVRGAACRECTVEDIKHAIAAANTSGAGINDELQVALGFAEHPSKRTAHPVGRIPAGCSGAEAEETLWNPQNKLVDYEFTEVRHELAKPMAGAVRRVTGR
jgi:hypothetical protein